MEMNDLKLAHDTVIHHPFRKENQDQYLKGYQNCLQKLTEEFWKVIKTDPLYQNAGNLIHSFRWAIYKFTTDPEAFILIERNLGVIHHYIDTGEIPEWYSYYPGCNILKSLPRDVTHRFNPETQSYYPVYTRQEVQNAIAEIKQSWIDHPIYKNYKFHPHSPDQLDYLEHYDHF